ncbi:MAG: hypothetical protein IJB96_10605 [Lachnospira sp.]|nr:hypothetical protein [Lachnospira sp.]
MKNLVSICTIIFMIVGFLGCGNMEMSTESDDQVETRIIGESNVIFDKPVYSKDGVDDVWPDIKAYYEAQNSSAGYSSDGYHNYWYSTIYNVTSKAVEETTGVRLFDSSENLFVENNGKISAIPGGFINAIPWDYDKDGNMDLLIASYSGSGFLFLELWVFNTKTNTSESVYFERSSDRMLYAVTSEAPEDENNASRCYVHVVNMQYEIEEIDFDSGVIDKADIGKMTDIEDKGLVGYIEYKGGKFVFEDYPWD